MDGEVEAELRELHARVCTAIADPKRLLIIHLLRHGELSVTEICRALSVSQSNASQHLAILRKRGIVRDRRVRTTVYYALTSSTILEAIDLMRQFVAQPKRAEPSPTAGRVSSVFLG